MMGWQKTVQKSLWKYFGFRPIIQKAHGERQARLSHDSIFRTGRAVAYRRGNSNFSFTSVGLNHLLIES